MRARKAGPAALTAILYFSVSGGAYGLETLVSSVGPALAVTLLFLTPLFVSLPTALMVAELSTAMPVEGGFYRWVDRALGRFWAFQEAWWSWTCSLPDMAIYPVLFAAYLGEAFQMAPGQRYVVALLMIWTCAVLNLLGIRTVGATALASLAFIVAPFLLFSLLALRQPGEIPWSLPGESASLLTGLSVVLWNYTGWDNISLVGGEVENPQRNYPIALFAALALIVAMYAGPVLAGLRVAPDPSAWTEGAFPTFALALPNAGWLSGWLLAGALVSTFTLFNSLLLSYSRLPMVVAEDGLLPGWLARVDARGVPAASVVASAVVYSVLAAFGFSKLVVMYVLLYTLSILLEFVSLWRLRRLEPDLPRPFRIGWGNLGLGLVTAPSLAIGVAVVIYTFWDNRGNFAWLAGAGAASLAGMPLYWILKKRPKMDADERR